MEDAQRPTQTEGDAAISSPSAQLPASPACEFTHKSSDNLSEIQLSPSGRSPAHGAAAAGTHSEPASNDVTAAASDLRRLSLRERTNTLEVPRAELPSASKAKATPGSDRGPEDQASTQLLPRKAPTQAQSANRAAASTRSASKAASQTRSSSRTASFTGQSGHDAGGDEASQAVRCPLSRDDAPLQRSLRSAAASQSATVGGNEHAPAAVLSPSTKDGNVPGQTAGDDSAADESSSRRLSQQKGGQTLFASLLLPAAESMTAGVGTDDSSMMTRQDRGVVTGKRPRRAGQSSQGRSQAEPRDGDNAENDAGTFRSSAHDHAGSTLTMSILIALNTVDHSSFGMEWNCNIMSKLLSSIDFPLWLASMHCKPQHQHTPSCKTIGTPQTSCSSLYTG